MRILKILIVEDEPIVGLELSRYLRQLNCEIVGISLSGEEAIKLAWHESIDVLLMDIYLEGEIDGIESAWQIKALNPNIEIIFLTANSDRVNLNRAINVEPLSYLSKPFNRQELYVAINMARRRIEKKIKKESKVILDSEFYYNIESKSLFYNKEEVPLTPKERMLLALLLRYEGKVVSYETIETVLWFNRVVTDNTLRTLVKRLREKLKYRFIETRSGEGYRLTLN